MLSNIKGRLDGRVAIITGASRGIGRAMALTFSHEGAKIVVNYHREESKAKKVVDEIKSLGGTAIALQTDVGDREAVEKMIELTLKEFSNIDILVSTMQGST